MLLKPEIFFNLLSDPTRLRCLLLLQQESELCVCEFMNALKMIQPKISRHLALLRKYKIVVGKRSGIWIYYRLNPELPEWVGHVLKATVEANKEEKPFQNDHARLKTMKDRPVCCP